MTEGLGNPALVEEIRSEIAESGPMRFDRYMELTLYSPGGYFRSDVLRSQREGDFLTSPEISPSFGAAFGRAVAAERARVGHPFTVVEAGAGSGSMLRPLLDGMDPIPDAVIAIEVSPPARRSLDDRLPEATVVDSLDAVPIGFSGVILANELLDNLPAALVVTGPGGWMERAVGVNGAALAWVEVPPREEVAVWANAHGGRVPQGGQVEVQLTAGAWLQAALGRLGAGAVIVIDYGDTAEGLEPRRLEGTMRTYRSHHLGPDPLLDPGSTDITMDVNFTALASTALQQGATTELWRQDEYLAHWGLLDEIEGLRAGELHAARAGNTAERLRLRSLVTGAEALIHPRGLGDFRVLVARV